MQSWLLLSAVGFMFELQSTSHIPSTGVSNKVETRQIQLAL